MTQREMSKFEPLQWAVTEPAPETVCTLCKGVFDTSRLITCPEKINICVNCANILKEIAVEREAEMKEKAVEEMLTIEKKMHDCYEPRDLMRQLYKEGYRKEAPRG